MLRATANPRGERTSTSRLPACTLRERLCHAKVLTALGVLAILVALVSIAPSALTTAPSGILLLSAVVVPYTRWRRLRPRVMYATAILLATNIAVFAAMEAGGSSTDTLRLLEFGASERSLVWDGEYWRLVTPMFLHYGLLHLAVNTVAVYWWGRFAERGFRVRRFLIIYFGSGVAALAIGQLARDGVAVGASGAVFGLIGALFYMWYVASGSWAAFFRLRAVQWVLASAAVLTVIGFTVLPIDNVAHAGGFVTGVVISYMFVWRRRALAALSALAFAALILVAATNIPGQHAAHAGYAELTRAQILLAEGDLAEALRLYDVAYDLGSRQTALFYNRGIIHLQLGRSDLARPDLQRALRDPSLAKEHREFAQQALDGLDDEPATGSP